MFPIRDNNPSKKFPLITIFIIFITSLIFFIELNVVDLNNFLYDFALVPSKVDLNNIETFLPFIYSIFLHGGWFHLISNMWFLWIFGDNIEADLGKLGFFIFYLLSGLSAGFLQYIINMDSNIPMLGASGAVAGVLGAYLVIYPKRKIDTLVISFGGFLSTVQIPASIMLGYWFVIQLFSGVGSVASMSEAGIAWWAHIGGFVFGWLSAKLIRVLNNNK